ncbi:KRT23 isoform 5 [Pongo abelii]|uniref:KRT23 isoform 3 n=1 Tax=Pongo abelii TaxID=9601 RepID=A0A2J8WAG8_PONAB|nr:KRT23 isoform 3 [Pongo abelii]PNJ66773.1 KRT23 isoform 5 [Pongo abelii]
MTNAQIILLIDNARMAVDDFNLKKWRSIMCQVTSVSM